MSLSNPDHPILFGLPYPITLEDQQEIIDYAYSNAKSWSGQVQVWDNEINQHEQTDYFGRVQITRLTDASRKKLGDGYNSDWINWASRLDPDLTWEWIDTPITPIVKKYVDQIQHLYKRFHRVLILVQKPGSKIPLHTDKVVKNVYNNIEFAPGPATDLTISNNNLHWEENRYLTLKWPLTELANNNGDPVVEIDNVLYSYNAGSNLFAINEVDIMHGANAVDHRRGVIFLDGILDYEKLKQEQWLDVSTQVKNKTQ